MPAAMARDAARPAERNRRREQVRLRSSESLSALVGPWDSAQVVQDQFYAVKKDVDEPN